MPQSKPSHQVCLQLPYVDSWPRVCLQGVVRDRNLRCGHVLRIGPASLAQLTASVAQELGDFDSRDAVCSLLWASVSAAAVDVEDHLVDVQRELERRCADLSGQ